MKLCCDRGREMMRSAGQDDFALLAKTSGEFRMFVLQARLVKAADEKKLSRVPCDVKLPAPLHVAMQMTVKFCPFCGQQLRTLIDADPGGFAALCARHLPHVF